MGLVIAILAFLFVAFPALTLAVSARMNSRDGHDTWPLFGRTFANNGLAMGLIILFFPLGFVAGVRRADLRYKRTGSPVLLIHGLFHNGSAWTVWRAWLKKAGFENAHTISYQSWVNDFEKIVELAADEARRILARYPDRKLYLVGHSMGGLVARELAAMDDIGPRLGAVATLGTPHQGSKLAAIAFSRPAKDLAFGGELARRVEGLPAPEGLPRLSLYTDLDNMVMPKTGLLTEQPGWVQEFVPGPISHLGLIFNRGIFARVVEFLKEAGS